MKTKIYKSCLWSSIALLFLCGCASVPKTLSEADREKVKRVVVATQLEDEKMSVLDIAQIRQRQHSKGNLREH